MKKTRKRYTREFKAQAVELVENGREVPELARELEVETSCLYAWVRKARAESTQLGGAGPRAEGELSEADELRRLRREVARLTTENTILKKAAMILGTHNQPRSNNAK